MPRYSPPSSSSPARRCSRSCPSATRRSTNRGPSPRLSAAVPPTRSKAPRNRSASSATGNPEEPPHERLPPHVLLRVLPLHLPVGIRAGQPRALRAWAIHLEERLVADVAHRDA